MATGKTIASIGNTEVLLHPVRSVRSYGRREGRITPSQRKALETLWNRYVIAPTPSHLELLTLFNKTAPIVLEIGFGNGETLVELAKRDTELNYIGAEVYRSGIGHLMIRLAEEEISNVRIHAGDALELLEHNLPKASLSRINLFFPDPWPKKKHHKRRIVNEPFIQLMRSRLARGGVFHFATDWAPYAEWTRERMEAAAGFRNARGKQQFTPRPPSRPVTKFEQRGARLGHGTWDLVYQRI